MKPSKDLDEQIDEILASLYNSAWVEGSNYKENNPEGSEIPSQREIKKTERAKQQLLALIEQREREARIDELTDATDMDGNNTVYVRVWKNGIGFPVHRDERIEALQKGDQ